MVGILAGVTLIGPSTHDSLSNLGMTKDTGNIQDPQQIVSGVLYTGSCWPWVQVNEGAFQLRGGLDQNGNILNPPPLFPYESQEAYETLVFKGQLYLGMEANDYFGARLWRTRKGVTVPHSQADWEEVIADAQGNPFGVANTAQNDHIDSLADFKGFIYASTANRGEPQGVRVFRSSSGDSGTWQDVLTSNGAGFGDLHNENFKAMREYDGWLCGGTTNAEKGAQVWCTQNGENWVQKNTSGFGIGSPDPFNREVWTEAVFNQKFYVGVVDVGEDASNHASYSVRLYRTSSLERMPVWSEIFSGTRGQYLITLLGSWNGSLYMAISGPGGVRIYRSDSGESGTWTQSNQVGMDGEAGNFGVVVDGATVYQGALYVAITNDEGLRLWRTLPVQKPGGNEWEQVSKGGLTDRSNIYSELTTFNGYLYAWTTNYKYGQEVLQTACGVCQNVEVHGIGAYSFADLDLKVNLHSGKLVGLEACVYPGAYWTALPESGADLRPVWVFKPFPFGAMFNADWSVSLEPANLADSEVKSTQLASWTGRGWKSCVGSSNPSNDKRLQCSKLNRASTWTILENPGVISSSIPVNEVRLNALELSLIPIISGWVLFGIIHLLEWTRHRKQLIAAK
jgi:hypothetical protein